MSHVQEMAVALLELNKSSQSYGVSLATWDHIVLPATPHKWTRPA